MNKLFLFEILGDYYAFEQKHRSLPASFVAQSGYSNADDEWSRSPLWSELQEIGFNVYATGICLPAREEVQVSSQDD